MSRRIALCICVLLASSSATFAAVPASITVQGRLTDSLGNPLPAGTKGFLFRIFNAATAGTEIWPGEDQFLPTDADGLWAAQVGAIVGLTDAVFADTVRWLEIVVNGTTLPRVRLVTGPYAHRVATVDGATGGNITSKVAIGSGHFNVGQHSFVAGFDNSVDGDYTSVTGGESNAANGQHSFVGGGEDDTAHGGHSVIGGGLHNVTSGEYATISGGNSNRAEFGSTVGGGQQNRATPINGATIGGGVQNLAEGSFSTIGGGYGNHTYGNYSVIGGGGGSGIDSNFANGIGATIPGGRRNRTNGDFAFAAGRRAQANHDGSFVWADSSEADFASTADDQFLIRAGGGVGIGTNSPDGPLHVMEGSAGSVTANPNASLVVERNDENWIHILSPDANQRGILFGSPTNALMGSIRFNPAGTEKGFHFRCGNNSPRLVLDSLGNLTADGCVVGSNIACPSDARFKRSIETIPDALDKVEHLRGVNYEWDRKDFADREFPEGNQVGLIAQEVQKVVPQAVHQMADGYLAVDYARLVPLLIESIKEQQKQIDELKKTIETITP